MASLLTVPLELLVSISSYLPTSDLAALRLTCKQAEKSLYEWFAKEFFTKKQFMLTHASLQTLIDISRHVSFSKKLTHVIIATNVYDENPLRFPDSGAATRYVQGYEDQKALLSTGVDREMLTEAFQKLENLATIGVRDFNAPSRVRDGAHASWSSWGATTVARETGVFLHFSNRGSFAPETGSRFGSRFVSRVFSTVLYAAGKAGRAPPEIEVLLRNHGLPDTAFLLPGFLRPTVQPMLDKLTKLLLNVDLTIPNPHTHGNGIVADVHAGRALRRFLSYTPNLIHLRLNFQKHLVPNNETFLSWLGEPTSASGSQSAPFFDPVPIALNNLKQLDFGQLNVSPDILINVVTKFAPTLDDMNFWRLDLRSQMLPPAGHIPNHWKEFFAGLMKISNLRLHHLKVGMLQQDHTHVNFKDGDDDKAQPLKSKEYSGVKMKAFMEELHEQVFIWWPEPVVQVEEDSDEDEEMADDDNDDEVNDEDEGSEEEEEEE